MTTARDRLFEAKARIAAFSNATPELFSGFAKISRVASTQKKITSANKELMATAIAVVKGCDDCILYHVDGAKRHGADEGALIEALEVAVEMGGGPAIMYASKALQVFRDL